MQQRHTRFGDSSAPGSPRWTRRACIAGAGGAAAALAGCALHNAPPASAASAQSNPQPNPANAQTKVVFYAKPPNASVNQKTIIGIMQETLQPYYAANKGLYVDIIPEELPTTQIVASILAGEQMDIIYDNYFAPYAEQNLVLPLGSYFQRDNVDSSIWNKAQFALYNTAKGPMAVPVYTGTSAIAVNQNMFDQAGFNYPTADWTHQEFTAVCRQMAHPAGKTPIYGGTVFYYSNGPGQQGSWPFKAFGGNQVSPVGPPSQLSSTQNTAALNWLYEELFWPKVAAPNNVIGITQFVHDQCAMIDMDTWELLTFAQSLSGTPTKFDFLPYPVFPAGRATFCTADFYAIAANCKQPDIAWDLLRWVSTEPIWQRATFSFALLSPALNSLWGEWATKIQQVIPFFAGKDFTWFGDAASKGYAYPVEYYPYSDQRVWQMIGPYFQQLYTQQLSVAAAARTIDHAVNAFEASAKQSGQGQQVQSQLFPSVGGHTIAVVPPGL